MFVTELGNTNQIFQICLQSPNLKTILPVGEVMMINDLLQNSTKIIFFLQEFKRK